MLLIVEVKVHPPAGQSQFAGQQVILMQPCLLARAQVEVDDIGQVSSAKASVEGQFWRLLVGNHANGTATAPLRLRQRLRDGPEVHARTHGPDSVDKWQTSPVVPLL